MFKICTMFLFMLIEEYRNRKRLKISVFSFSVFFFILLHIITLHYRIEDKPGKVFKWKIHNL